VLVRSYACDLQLHLNIFLPMHRVLDEILVCPCDRTDLTRAGDWLTCTKGHRFPIVDEIPVMLVPDVRQTAWWATSSIQQANDTVSGNRTVASLQPANLGDETTVDPYVQLAVASTGGYLYGPLVGQLRRYPIPDLRALPSDGSLFLDIGCNWGRWCVAAARKGYRPIGIDPTLEAVLAARRVTRALGVDVVLVVGDGRYLPFREESIDFAFSYSVVQHLSKEDAKMTLASTRSVLKAGGKSKIQMPNRYGVRSLYHQARRGFTEGVEFDVRYWTPGELLECFSQLVGPSRLEVDGYFGLGVQPADRPLLPRRYRAVVTASEILRTVSHHIPAAIQFADSLYVDSVRT
jgi:SAM-dependent methyltransferase/uncharacterized protein YbaR (Trm112 family)